MSIKEFKKYRRCYKEASRYSFPMSLMGGRGVYTHKALVAFNFLRPGDSVIDVGAHIGDYTLLFRSLVGKDGLVISYEPNPYAYRVLERRVQKTASRGSQVVLKQKGASFEASQSVAMKIKPWTLAESSTIESELMDSKRMPGKTKMINIQLEPLDTLSPKNLKLIKVDAEGHDSKVLKGAEELIKSHQPVIIFEYGVPHDTFKEPNTIEQMEGLGYECYDLSTLTSAREKGVVCEDGTDIVAVSKKDLKQFQKLVDFLN